MWEDALSICPVCGFMPGAFIPGMKCPECGATIL
jgi:rubrerythrin